MKTILRQRLSLAAAILLAASPQLRAQPEGVPKPAQDTLTTSLSSDIKPLAVLDAMQRVADWQLAHPSAHKPTDWTQGAGDAGFMALAGISGNSKYRDAMLAMAATNGWQPGPRPYHADDQCVGQTYAELYFLYRDPKMIAPLRERFDFILSHPSAVTNLASRQPHGQSTELWSWCDSLFMAPPAWLRLYAATDDGRYLDFTVTNWWRTTDYLYDPNEHLFFRDSTYFNQTEANGKKVFWGRGNGWVMGGLVRVLQYLPMNHPDRPRFEQLFKDLAGKILICQQPDGLWRSSLLDPESYPLKETSGSGFFTYALAWGVNQGLLDRAKFEPAVRKAWTALVGCVDAAGKLTHVQPVGADPKKFDESATEVYGVGAFLLAGSEVYRMAVLEKTMTNPGSHGISKRWSVSITNPTNFRRHCETVEVFPGVWRQIAVMDGLSSRILDSQVYSTETNSRPDKLLFQVDLAPGETRTFYLLDASALAAVPPPIVKTFARYVPERLDDFTWENDRTAHRVYGQALIKAEKFVGSGMDVWSKRTRNLIVDELYRNGDYHNDHGDGMDDYRVGASRGCGGIGVWDGKKLYVSSNYQTWRLITTGPIRSEFELTYDAWDADGRKVSETKRIRIDAGSNLSRVESIFSSDDQSPLQIGVGLAERPGENTVVPDGSPVADSWPDSTAKGLVVQNQSEGCMTYWQPQDFNKGTIGVAIILPKGGVLAFTNDLPNPPASAFAPPTHTMQEGQRAVRNLLALAPAEVGKPFVYYFGAGWSQSGDFPTAAAWNKYIKWSAECRDEPLQVTVGN